MQTWTQVYDPLGKVITFLPPYVFSALIAAIPMYILFYLLAVRRAPGYIAACSSTFAAVVLSIAVWGMPASLSINSVVLGACFGLFPIVWIILTGVWIYNMTVESGQFEIIKGSLATLTDDRRLQALFIAFAFGAFIEGTAGFGTPVAITAAMLVGLGFNPLYAAGICLIANTAPVAFGSLGIPIVTAGVVTGLSDLHISAIAGRQLPLLSILVPLWLSVTMCGFKRSMEVMPAILVAGLAFALTQFVASNFHGPWLPDILSAIVTILALIALLRVWKPQTNWHFPDEPPVTYEGQVYTAGQVLRAWSPYIILACTVLVWGLPAFKKAVLFTQTTVPWPGLHNLIIKAAPIVAKNSPYAANYIINPVTAAGTAVLLSGALAIFLMPGYGFGRAAACFGRTVVQLRFPVLTISMMLALAYIMNYSGMSSTLGLAFTNAGWFFPFFAPILGWLGVFLTGSDTSSNALFGSLQRTTAEALNMDPHLMVASNSTGGVAGKMISPQSISVATAATGMIGQEGNLFRFTLFHSIAMVLVLSVLTFLQAYWLKWMLP